MHLRLARRAGSRTARPCYPTTARPHVHQVSDRRLAVPLPGRIEGWWKHGALVVRSRLPWPRSMNYARRLQYRRLLRAGEAGGSGVVIALLGSAAASDGALNLAVGLLLIAAALGLCSRHQLSLAGRSRVGARSEDEVRGVLSPLEAEGWRVRHSLRWRGQGDIDSVAIAPSGIAIAIETKTRTYDARHLARVREQASWLSRRRRRWARIRRACRDVPRQGAGRRARRARRSRGLDRPVDACPSRRSGDGFRRPFKQLTADPGERSSAAAPLP